MTIFSRGDPAVDLFGEVPVERRLKFHKLPNLLFAKLKYEPR